MWVIAKWVRRFVIVLGFVWLWHQTSLALFFMLAYLAFALENLGADIATVRQLSIAGYMSLRQIIMDSMEQLEKHRAEKNVKR